MDVRGGLTLKVLQTLAEGGQTWAHRVRMVRQVLKMALSFSLLTSACYLGYTIYRLDPLLSQSAYYYVKSEIGSLIALKEVSVSPNFWEKVAHERVYTKEKRVPPTTLKRFTQPHAQHLFVLGKHYLFKSVKFGFFVFAGALIFFVVRGSNSKRKQHISGKKRIHPFLLRWQLIVRGRASDLRIAKLPLIKRSETQHILVTGGTGTGKTNCFHHILPQVRERKQKAVIIDTTGSFLQRYYNPKKDIILNPFDAQAVSWHPWIECHDCFDFDNLAESIIPQSYNDHENYWRTAARCLFSAVLQKLKDAKRTSELAHWLLFEPLENLAEFVQHTKAAAHIDTSSEKTAASIRSVAASFLGCLEYLKDTPTPFSIKNWIQDDKEEGWLFLSAKPSQRATLNPLIACWFSLAVRSLIQMTPDLNRRVWFVIDELPTLQKLKELDPLVTESRKYGGCALIALQSPAQLEEIYGRASSQAIIGNCATRVIFAEHDPEISEKISKSLGENEIKEYQEGISYGAHEVRDGVNLPLQKKNYTYRFCLRDPVS